MYASICILHFDTFLSLPDNICGDFPALVRSDKCLNLECVLASCLDLFCIGFKLCCVNPKEGPYIYPLLTSLHRLPVKFRKKLKLLQFVFKALNSLAPPYISDLLSPHSTSRSFRSSSQPLLSVPHFQHKLKGDQAISVELSASSY